MFAKICGSLLIASFAVFTLSSTGCNQKGKEEAKAKTDAKEEKKGDGKKEITKGDAKHDGWWCQEHGVPEHICSLCSDEVASKCKKEGDWCKLHDRAQSQCFKCDPSKYAKFEAMHVAKFGKAPERPPESEFKK
jgi:hypothetical protein